jgi:hypothetical protein
MKRSGDRVIGRSGDRNKNLTAETRRRGEGDGADSFDHPITRDHRITRSSNRLRHVLLIILATLREIFDESAYDRFLSRTRAPRSVESYREFLRERESIVARKPRCC